MLNKLNNFINSLTTAWNKFVASIKQAWAKLK